MGGKVVKQLNQKCQYLVYQRNLNKEKARKYLKRFNFAKVVSKEYFINKMELEI